MRLKLFHCHFPDELTLTDDVEAGGEIVGAVGDAHAVEIVDLNRSVRIGIDPNIVYAAEVIFTDIFEIHPRGG